MKKTEAEVESTTVEIRYGVQTSMILLMVLYLQQQKLDTEFRPTTGGVKMYDLQQQKLDTEFRPRGRSRRSVEIYNSRNQIRSLDAGHGCVPFGYLQQQKLDTEFRLLILGNLFNIYNSRNQIRSLDNLRCLNRVLSTTVEIRYGVQTFIL